VIKTLPGAPNTVSHYHFDRSGRLLAESDGQGNVRQEYLWLDDTPVAEVIGNQLYFVGTDHLATPQGITDGQQNLVWDAVFRPFGQIEQLTATQTSNLRFPGQYFDAESSRSYNYFRDYDAGIGRYIQSDPIGLKGGSNTYAYVDGDPISGIDPLGLYHLTRTAGGDVDTATSNMLQCMDRCTGTDLEISGAREGGHSQGSAHETGQACDISKRGNPGLSRPTVQQCFAQCAPNRSYGQEESNHYHLQTRPGRGGATGFADGVH
jgi:RHS repeat-associated protein